MNYASFYFHLFFIHLSTFLDVYLRERKRKRLGERDRASIYTVIESIKHFVKTKKIFRRSTSYLLRYYLKYTKRKLYLC